MVDLDEQIEHIAGQVRRLEHVIDEFGGDKPAEHVLDTLRSILATLRNVHVSAPHLADL